MSEFTVDQALYAARKILNQSSISHPAFLARKLASQLLGLEPSQLIAMGPMALDPAQSTQLIAGANRLADGEPLSRITGIAEFYGRQFCVTPDVLDPRPETELLVDAVLSFVKTCNPLKPITLTDIGTGSGIIPVTLLKELPELHAFGIDISEPAAALAFQNAKKLDVASRFAVIVGSLLEAVSLQPDIIVANLPYISSETIPLLDAPVRLFDPHIALDGGPVDGFMLYDDLLRQIGERPVKPLFIAFEIGFDQAEIAVKAFEKNGLNNPAIQMDDGGNPRIVRWAPDE